MTNHCSKIPGRSCFSLQLRELFLAVLFVCGTYTLQAQVPCATFSNNIAYVNGVATGGTHDGTSWATAFLTLEEGLAAARSCGVTQIWVARGTYQPTAYPVGITSTGTLSSADYSFHLVDGVAIYGGFSGLGFETQLSQRNARLNATILSGGGTTRHVLLSVNDGLATVVDGFTITGGSAPIGGSSSTVEGVLISGNRGAGMFLAGSSITLSNLIFTGNQADYAGGMVIDRGGSVLTNMVFVGNSAGNAGGALQADNSTFTLTNGVFAGNISTGNGGGAMVLFGGSQTLRNVVFSQNSAPRSNPASTGGGIYNVGSTLDLINCTFFGNSAQGTGGAMYNVNFCTIRDKNGIYYGNTAASSPDVRNYTPGSDTFTPTTTLFDTDPKFINSAGPDGPDNVWMTADDGLALQSTSPAINAGTTAGAPTTDILGAARVGNTDQGAYERTPCTGFIVALTPANTTLTCANPSVTLTASATGATSYTLTNGPTNTTGQFTVSAQGLYTVTASNGSGCTSEASALVAFAAPPTAYALTGGGAYCAGGAGVAIGLAGSENSVSYQLKLNGNNVGSPVAGTGGPISFGNQTLAGNYTVTATNLTTNCTADMTGSATVMVNPLPKAAVSGGGVVCADATRPDVSIALTGTAPFNFTYTDGTTTTPVTGTSTNPYLIANAPAGTYTVTALSDANCTGTSSGSATVTVNALPTATVSGGGTVCAGQPLPDVSIALTGMAPFTFTFTDGTTPTTVTGTSTNPYLIANAPAGTYTVTALSDANCAGTSFSGSATVTVRPAINLTTSGNTTVILGYGGATNNCTTLTANATGGTDGINLSWSNNATGGSTQVCPTTSTTYTVTATDGAGCTATQDIRVTVQDVRCGNGGVKVCFYGREICIAQYLVPTYLRLGAKLGGCGNPNARIGVEETTELPLQLTLKAYPNPVQDAVTVEVLSRVAGVATFEVLDVGGRARQSRQQELVEGLNEVEFRLGTLPTGIYLIKVHRGYGVDALGQQGVVRVSKQ